MAQAKTTVDHGTIRRWVENCGGRPARVKHTGKGEDPGILRIDFDEPDESLEKISWEEFFAKFEQNQLALLYQEQDESGRPSRFNKLVRRDSQRH